MSRVKVVIFDLDDTLYPEITFVESGFRSVAIYLGKKFNISEDKLYKAFVNVLEEDGRGKVFDSVLKRHGIFSRSLVKQCLSVYRNHHPSISLFPGVEKMLLSLNDYRIFIVTDGNKNVQARKINALGLQGLVEKSYLTYRYGIKNMKPSIYCFELISKRAKVSFSEMVYIGDNPQKDFVNIKRAGMRTIRVLQGQYRDYKAVEGFDAEITVNSITDIVGVLKKFD